MPDTETTSSLDEWAKIELFGHTVLYAKVTKADFGDFLRLDIPNQAGEIDQTRLINPKAIYGITFITRELCLKLAAGHCQVPIYNWQILPAPKPALPAGESNEDPDGTF